MENRILHNGHLSKQEEKCAYIFNNKTTMIDEVAKNIPLSGIHINGSLFLLFHPSSDDNVVSNISRSSIGLCKIVCQDSLGDNINGCWFSPIELTTNYIMGFNSLKELNDNVKEYILFLPLLDDTNTPINNYYIVNDHWKERNQDGSFSYYNVDKDLFSNWVK